MLSVGVLAVQGDFREHLAAVRECGHEAVSVRRPEELAAVDALILPGGESTTMDKLVRAFGLQEPLRERLRGGMPVYGSCAGMIMLADRILDGRPDQETLGGLDVTVRRNAFGRQVDSFEEDLHVTGLPGGPVRAVFIRAPWVEDHGPEVEVLAAVTVGDREHPVVVRHGPLLATSFHPEVTRDLRIHRTFLDDVARARRG